MTHKQSQENAFQLSMISICKWKKHINVPLKLSFLDHTRFWIVLGVRDPVLSLMGAMPTAGEWRRHHILHCGQMEDRDTCASCLSQVLSKCRFSCFSSSSLNSGHYWNSGHHWNGGHHWYPYCPSHNGKSYTSHQEPLKDMGWDPPRKLTWDCKEIKINKHRHLSKRRTAGFQMSAS